MTSTGRPNFWIPPDNAFETAVPIATSSTSTSGSPAVPMSVPGPGPGPLEPSTPTRTAPRTATPMRTTAYMRPPPLPLSPQRGPSAPGPSSAPQRPVAPPISKQNSRTGQEYNRRERKFESLFKEWSKKMTELEEEHRLVNLRCNSEEESKRAMEEFNRKAQSVFTRYNEEIEALQMSSSEPGSSQSEASEDDDDDDDDDDEEAEVMAGPTPVRSRQEGPDEEDEGDSEEEDEEEEEDEDEDEDDDEDDADGDGRPSTPMSEPYNIEASSGDDTDQSARKSRRSSRGYQSSEVSNGSLGLNTPPPTEVDEDWRATRRRQAREKRKTDELASALPQRLRSSTVRGSSPAAIGVIPIAAASRPAAMSLFETLSSSPASISSIQAPSSFVGSRRSSRDVSTSRPPTVELDPNQPSSRIEFLRRQNSTSGSDRSLSRPRQPSPSPSPIVDEHRLFRDQFEGWKTAVRDRSDHWIRKAEQQTEDTKQRFQKEQEEKHKRAQQLFIARQEEMLNHFNRNRAGSIGSGSANMPSPVNSMHPRTGSFASTSGLGPSASPTMQRHGGIPSSASPVTHRGLQNSVSQTFQFASTPSHSPPAQSQQPHSQSPSQTQSRTWVPSSTPLASGRSGKFNHVPSTASSSDSEGDGGINEEEEIDAPVSFTQNGTPPISIPNSTRGSFDHGHRRTNTAVFTGTPSGAGPSSTPRSNFPQHLRNSSSTTFSSSGTASARSSGGWSGVSGTSSNTTVISDTPGSRRGSVGDKSSVQPNGLHDHPPVRKTTLPLPTTLSASPPKPQQRWTSMEGGASTSHSPASTISRGSISGGNAGVHSRPTAQQWQNILSSSPSAAPVVTAISSGSTNHNSSSTPSASTVRPIPSSINLGQSPGKTTWKPSGQPSPPIPIQTRPSSSNISPLPSHFGRFDLSNGLSSSPGMSPSFTTPKPSPPLRSSISNTDLFSSSMSGSGTSGLKSRSSVATFVKPLKGLGEGEFERISRAASPSKPGLVPTKASPSPATVTTTSTQVKPNKPDQTPVQANDPPPSRKELKRKAKNKGKEQDRGREKELEEEEQRKKQANDAEQSKKAQEERDAEVQRKEEEKKKQEQKAKEDLRRKQEEEELRKREEEEQKKKKEEEERKKKEEEVRRREEEVAKQEAELRRREEEYERRQKEEELRRREENVRKKMEELKRREDELQRRQEEEKQREQQENSEERADERPPIPVQQPAQSQPQPSQSQHQPAQSQPQTQSLRRKGEKKQRKRVNDDQKEREAELERKREEEQRHLRQAQEESDRLEAERLAAEEEEEVKRLDAERLELERQEEERARELKETLQRQEQALLEETRQRQEQKLLARAREEEQRQARARREEEQRRQAQARREDEQRQTRLRQQEEQRQAQLRQEEDRRQRNSRTDDDRRSEEERRTAERIRQENDRLTEMFQARERSQQMSSNMPRRFAEAWESYDDQWKSLQAQSGASASGSRLSLTFATVPWPTLNPPSGPDAITRNVVGAFILSQWHSQGKSRKNRIHDALLRWHPDRFETRYLGLVPEGEERENVRVGVGNVTRSLHELLAAEGAAGHL